MAEEGSVKTLESASRICCLDESEEDEEEVREMREEMKSVRKMEHRKKMRVYAIIMARLACAEKR